MHARTLAAGEYSILFGQDKLLQTKALGSGVAVIIQDMKSKTSGLVHVLLPDSTIDPDRAREAPGTFADTAIPTLLDAFAENGLRRNPGDYSVSLVGGANVADPGKSFDLGARNVEAVKSVLRENDLSLGNEAVGGRFSRSVVIHVGTCKVEVISAGRNSKFL